MQGSYTASDAWLSGLIIQLAMCMVMVWVLPPNNVTIHGLLDGQKKTLLMTKYV